MKELGNTLAQLFFIIMVMIVLAVSTATLSQWASAETSAPIDTRQDESATQTLSASATQ